MSFISPTVKTLVDQILDDPEFKARCKKNFDLIFADKVELLDPDPNKEAEEVMEKWGVSL